MIVQKQRAKLWIPPLIKVERIWPIIIIDQRIMLLRLKGVEIQLETQMVLEVPQAELKVNLLKVLLTPPLRITPMARVVWTSKPCLTWQQRFLESTKTRKIVKSFQTRQVSTLLLWRETRLQRPRVDKALFIRATQLPWIQVHPQTTNNQSQAQVLEPLKGTTTLQAFIIPTGAAGRDSMCQRLAQELMADKVCSHLSPETTIRRLIRIERQTRDL